MTGNKAELFPQENVVFNTILIQKGRRIYIGPLIKMKKKNVIYKRLWNMIKPLL